MFQSKCLISIESCKVVVYVTRPSMLSLVNKIYIFADEQHQLN